MKTLWTKAMKEALPRSKAKTADGLLAEIQRLILAEPKRYFQGDWVRLDRTTPQEDRGGSDTPEFPACGTIGCVAGWATLLKGPTKVIKKYVLGMDMGSGYYETDSVSRAAEKILGLSALQSIELFDGDPDGFSTYEVNPATGRYERKLSAKPGTKAYARLGYNHIAKFRRKYRAQLRAHRLEA